MCKPTGTPIVICARPYRAGEAALIPVAERDPSAGWLQEMEETTHGLTSYERDGALIAVTGYQIMWDGVAWAFALVDRAASAGAGKELAAQVRCILSDQIMQSGVHRVQACCNPADPVTKVFLRACGFRVESTMRRAAPGGGDLLMMTIVRGD